MKTLELTDDELFAINAMAATTFNGIQAQGMDAAEAQYKFLGGQLSIRKKLKALEETKE